MRLLFAAGRFDRPARAVRVAVKRWLADHPDVDVTAGTELRDPDRADAFHPGDGWDMVHLHEHPRLAAAECALAYRLDRYEVEGAWPWLLGDGHELAGKPPTIVLAVLLRDLATGHRHLVIVGHKPAGVESPGGWREGRHTWRWLEDVAAQVISHRKAMLALKARIREARRELNPDHVTAVADWNTSFRQAWVRAYYRAVFPWLLPTWRKPFPAEGTHRGGRLIDAALSDAVQSDAEILDDHGSSDHGPFVVTLTPRRRGWRARFRRRLRRNRNR